MSLEIQDYLELAEKLDKDRTQEDYPTNIEMIIQLTKKVKELEERILQLEGR